MLFVQFHADTHHVAKICRRSCQILLCARGKQEQKEEKKKEETLCVWERERGIRELIRTRFLCSGWRSKLRGLCSRLIEARNRSRGLSSRLIKRRQTKGKNEKRNVRASLFSALLSPLSPSINRSRYRLVTSKLYGRRRRIFVNSFEILVQELNGANVGDRYLPSLNVTFQSLWKSVKAAKKIKCTSRCVKEKNTEKKNSFGIKIWLFCIALLKSADRATDLLQKRTEEWLKNKRS